MGWNLFHDGLEVAGFHGVDRALRFVNVGVARFHGGDVREDFVIAEVAIHGVEDLHRVGWWGVGGGWWWWLMGRESYYAVPF